MVYIHGGGQVLCDFHNKKWSSLGCFLDGGWGCLFLRFLCTSSAVVGGVAVVVAVVGTWCGNVMEVFFVRCTVMVTVVSLKISEVMHIHIWHSTI